MRTYGGTYMIPYLELHKLGSSASLLFFVGYELWFWIAEELYSNTALQGEGDVVIRGSSLYGVIEYTVLGTPYTTVLYPLR